VTGLVLLPGEVEGRSGELLLVVRVIALEKEEGSVPKRKTHKGLAKRVKVTATGKLLRRRAGKAHLLSKKGHRQRRRLSADKELTGGQAKMVRRQLGR